MRSRSLSGKPARLLRTAWTEAWEREECPGTLPKPLQFMATADVHYAEAWAFCHFLWNAPGRESGKGRYRSVLVKLIHGLRRGLPRDELYREAFKLNGKPLDLGRLHDEFIAYIRTLKAK